MIKSERRCRLRCLAGNIAMPADRTYVDMADLIADMSPLSGYDKEAVCYFVSIYAEEVARHQDYRPQQCLSAALYVMADIMFQIAEAREEEEESGAAYEFDDDTIFTLVRPL